DGVMPKDEIVAYLERYTDRFGAPIGEGVEVRSLARGADSNFVLETTAGQLQARTVVVCTGAYQRPHRPAGASTVPGDVFAIDVEGYRSPSPLPPCRVLVVVSGQSGCQIAEELHEAGREVVVACGRAPWSPRRLGDRDLVWWIVETGFWDAPLSSLRNPADRLFANVLATGHGGAMTCTCAPYARSGLRWPVTSPGSRTDRSFFPETLGRPSPGATTVTRS